VPFFIADNGADNGRTKARGTAYRPSRALTKE